MPFNDDHGPPGAGLFAVNTEPAVGPRELEPPARLLEELGYESVWAGERPLPPDPPNAHSPWNPRMPLVDRVTVLSFLAEITERLRVATGILLPPTRYPVVLAEQFASLDVLSEGRAILGSGMVCVPTATDATGADHADRGARGEEYLAALRRAVTSAHGWFGWDLTPERPADLKELPRAAAERYGRPRWARWS